MSLDSRQVSWFHRFRRALIEFFVIFLGVSLSFVAEDWREARNDRQEERKVLELLATDLERDISGIQSRMRVDSLAASAGDWLHANWERSSLPDDSLNDAWEWLHRGGPYAPIRSGYESANSSGRLQLLQDHELRGDLAAYYERDQPRLVRVNEITIDFDFDVWTLLRPYYRFSEEVVSSRSQVIPPLDMGLVWGPIRRDNELRSAVVQAAGFRRMFSNQMSAHLVRTSELAERIRILLPDVGSGVEDTGTS